MREELEAYGFGFEQKAPGLREKEEKEEERKKKRKEWRRRN